MLNELLKQLGFNIDSWKGKGLSVASPIDGAALAELAVHDARQVDGIIGDAHKAFHAWRALPAPKRGELVRLLGEELRTYKEALGNPVTLECGKILQEGL
ncbi:aldehyde dehydrogenase family protein, partial [bacterium]|nr:aldehyde dehydrogenase family protein [bacterium]